jgi:hypothetical protein
MTMHQVTLNHCEQVLCKNKAFLGWFLLQHYHDQAVYVPRSHCTELHTEKWDELVYVPNIVFALPHRFLSKFCSHTALLFLFATRFSFDSRWSIRISEFCWLWINHWPMSRLHSGNILRLTSPRVLYKL